MRLSYGSSGTARSSASRARREPSIAAGDPLFARAVAYLDAGLASGCRPDTDPRNCGNGGRAVHNIQGSFTLFGDLFTKAGRPEDAALFYSLAVSLPGSETYRFTDLISQRAATLDDRAVRWADADPDNDPRLIGNGPEACAYCHFR